MPRGDSGPRGATCDAALPGASLALSVERMLELLREHVPEIGADLDLVGGRILEVQYRAGSECVVTYRLSLRPASGGRTRKCDVHARVLRAGEAPRGLPPEVGEDFRSLDGGPLRTPYVYLPGPGIEVFAFPADPVLVQLVEALDAARMRKAFSWFWRHRNVHVRRVSPTVLAYVPRSRAAILYEVLSETPDTKVPELRRLVGKINVSKPSGPLFAFAWSVWSEANGRVRLAPPVGHIGFLNMTLQEHVRGTRVGELVGEPVFQRLVGNAAWSLKVLHGLRVPPRSVRKAGRIVEGVERWAAVVASLLPERAGQVGRVRDVLASEISSRMSVSAMVHGDFHPANLLAHEDRVTIIDLDQMSLSDPLVDVGRFRAALRVSALRVHGDADALRRPADRLLERYLGHTGEDERRAMLFEAASLLTSAATGFRLQREGWRDSAGILCDEAERVTQRATRAPPAPVGGGARCASGFTIERLEDWLGRSHYVEAMLDPIVRDEYGASLRRCRVSVLRAGHAHVWLSLRLSGLRDGARWRCLLDGLARRHRSGQGPHARLAALHAGLRGCRVLRLPRPVAYVRPLRLALTEAPSGPSLRERLESGTGETAAERVGEALLELHRCGVDVGRTYPLEREIEKTERRIAQIGESDPAAAARLGEALREAARRAIGVAAPAAPTLRALRVAHVVCDEETVTPIASEDVRMSHPLLDVGNALAMLARESEAVGAAAVRAAAAALRARYLDGGGFSAGDLAGFEALALVARSARDLAAGRRRSAAESLVDEAGHVLGTTHPKPRRA